MTETTDLDRYRYRVYLELCLELVDGAYKDLKKERYDLAEEQLQEILDIFDKNASELNKLVAGNKNILPFSRSAQ